MTPLPRQQLICSHTILVQREKHQGATGEPKENMAQEQPKTWTDPQPLRRARTLEEFKALSSYLKERRARASLATSGMAKLERKK